MLRQLKHLPRVELRSGRALKSNRRRVVDLTLSPSLLDQAQTTFRRIVDVAAEEIERELEGFFLQHALPDRHDAREFGSYFPGDIARVTARVRARFQPGAVEHAFQAIARAVDTQSYEKLSRVPGIDVSKIITGAPAALERFRATNAALIQSVPEQMARDVGAKLAQADVRSLHVSEAKKVLQSSFDVSASQAEFWSRDQTLKLYGDVNEARHKQAGVRRYEWATSDDERVRGRPGGLWAHSPSDHFILNHTIQSWDLAPIVDPRTGRRCHPGKDYQCRCTAYPHIEVD